MTEGGVIDEFAEFGNESPVVSLNDPGSGNEHVDGEEVPDSEDEAKEPALPMNLTGDPAVRVSLMVRLDTQHQKWLETDNLYHLGRRALGTPHTEWSPVLQNVVDDAMEFADQQGAESRLIRPQRTCAIHTVSICQVMHRVSVVMESRW
jgi:hypothetical protein